MKGDAENLPNNFIDTIQDCVSLLENELPSVNKVVSSKQPEPSLLRQCEELIKADQGKPDPIRTIHHFSCTGGTLFSKCLGSMPNTQLLGEVEPHSKMQAGQAFSPTDLIRLLRTSSRKSSPSLESEVFNSGLHIVYKNCLEKGLSLILRDHAHSRYCYGDICVDDRSLLSTVKVEYETISVVTVRHPLDSYLSLVAKNWAHFSPNSLEEYSKRYIQFLDDLSGIKIFKYEDLVDFSEVTMKDMCEELKISYYEYFESVLGAFRLSGDSGRSSNQIGRRSRRSADIDIASELQNSPSFHDLCRLLEYDTKL